MVLVIKGQFTNKYQGYTPGFNPCFLWNPYAKFRRCISIQIGYPVAVPVLVEPACKQNLWTLTTWTATGCNPCFFVEPVCKSMKKEKVIEEMKRLQSLFFVEPICKWWAHSPDRPAQRSVAVVAVLVFRGTCMQDRISRVNGDKKERLQSLFFVEPVCKGQKFVHFPYPGILNPIFPIGLFCEYPCSG